MVVAVSTAVATEPDVASLPLHPPEAVQEVAFVEVQVSVDACPEVSDVGLAVILTLGAGVGKVADSAKPDHKLLLAVEEQGHWIMSAPSLVELPVTFRHCPELSALISE